MVSNEFLENGPVSYTPKSLARHKGNKLPLLGGATQWPRNPKGPEEGRATGPNPGQRFSQGKTYRRSAVNKDMYRTCHLPNVWPMYVSFLGSSFSSQHHSDIPEHTGPAPLHSRSQSRVPINKHSPIKEHHFGNPKYGVYLCLNYRPLKPLLLNCQHGRFWLRLCIRLQNQP